LCIGCLSPIDIDGDNIGGSLVVSGQISTLAEQSIVQLGRTAATERLPFPLSGATVTLWDDAGNSQSYTEDLFQPGTYLLENATAEVGRAYHIQVVTPEGIYESVPEIMPDAAGSITTDYEVVYEDYTDGEGTVTNNPFVKVYADVTLPESSSAFYIKWNVDEVFLLTPTDFPDPFAYVPPPCFVAQNADPQLITLFDGDLIQQSSFDQTLVASRLVDWTFLERHYFTTYQSRLTKEAFDYWTKVNILANSNGSIFDTPPAEIRGNITNVNNPNEKVHGYFQAVNQTYDRFFLLPADFPFRLLFEGCVFESFSTRYPNRCLECLSVRNSSYRRPTWF
jgi:hypothetical protein